MKLNFVSVLVIVTLSAMGGLMLGGAFGYVAGRVSPDLFTEVIFNAEVDPQKAATVGGAAGGVFLGGGLGVFAVLAQLCQQWLIWLNRRGQ